MKNLLKVFLSILALGFVAAANVQAQPPAGGPGGPGGGRGRGPGMTIEAIEGVVGTLTADQKTKINAAIEKSAKDREAAMQNQDMAKMQEINTTLRTSVRAALTAEQAAKFDESPLARGGGRRGGNGPGGPGGAPGANK